MWRSVINNGMAKTAISLRILDSNAAMAGEGGVTSNDVVMTSNIQSAMHHRLMIISSNDKSVTQTCGVSQCGYQRGMAGVNVARNVGGGARAPPCAFQPPYQA